ncbi:hypothetical protein FFZ77_21270 [Streptomyces katsurahamanus]|uniref:Uncharacterized protein n=2 Tax=Streptomyces TaxID=1883 RepID=A0A646KE48_STRJU|nr:hypothetical protein [Streptomyces katsurahamanus]MQS99285.1 hypothetical protein [Streptomyces jumonjinensis]
MLWRTRQNLCTDRGTALWTKSCRARCTRSDLHLFHPLAVGKKNFPARAKIRTNGAHSSRHHPVM